MGMDIYLAAAGLSRKSEPSMKSGIILTSLRRWTLKGAVWATLAAIAMAFKAQELVHYNVADGAWGVILGVMVVSVVVLNFIIGAVQGFLQQENNLAAPEGLESVAVS